MRVDYLNSSTSNALINIKIKIKRLSQNLIPNIQYWITDLIFRRENPYFEINFKILKYNNFKYDETI
jgi:hypothetical protein